MQIQGQEHFEKELAKGRDKHTSAKGCGNYTLSVGQAATSPKSPVTQGLFLSADVPLFLPEAFTPEHQCHPLARTRSASVGSQDVCSRAGTGLAPSCLPTRRPLRVRPRGRDNIWFCLQSLQARKVLRADKAKP